MRYSWTEHLKYESSLSITQTIYQGMDLFTLWFMKITLAYLIAANVSLGEEAYVG